MLPTIYTLVSKVACLHGLEAKEFSQHYLTHIKTKTTCTVAHDPAISLSQAENYDYRNPWVEEGVRSSSVGKASD